MDEIILDFCRDNLTPGHHDTCIKAMQILQSLNFNELEDSLLDLITQVEVVGLTTTVDRLIQLINSDLDQAFLLFNITLNKDTNYSIKVDILDAIITLEDIDEIDMILDTIESGNEARETLADLLEFNTDYSADELLDYIDTVKPTLIERIKQVFTTRKENSYNLENEDCDEVCQMKHNKCQEYQHYRNFMHDEIGPLSKLLENSYPFYLPFNQYIDNILELSTVLDDGRVAQSLIGAAIISDGTESALEKITEYTELFDTEPNKAIDIANQAKQILVKFENYLRTKTHEQK